MSNATIKQGEKISYDEFKAEILDDLKLAFSSREASLIGRKEVLTGKAKFGIFGDGKELPQIALAKCFQPGDIRSGYYRDQTLMVATGMTNFKEFFAQLYANPDISKEPATGGRMMNGHYGTRWLDENGEWKNLTESPNSTSDISPTAGQMVRSLGIAYASKLYRNADNLKSGFEKFSNNGNEVSFVTIGDASTSEGLFWESVNAAAVLKVPLAICVWDDGYGISVPKAFQTAKSSISKALSGMEYDEDIQSGVKIFKAKAWDYVSLVEMFKNGVAYVRENHIPALFHIQEVTQPQGHSTSGSHERYKTSERLDWEKEWDCNKKLVEFILENEIATQEEIDQVINEAKEEARKAKQDAWSDFLNPIKELIEKSSQFIGQLVMEGGVNAQNMAQAVQQLSAIKEPLRKDVYQTIAKALAWSENNKSVAYRNLQHYYEQLLNDAADQFSSHLFSQSAKAIANIKEVKAEYSEESKVLNGYEVLNHYFDQLLEKNPAVFAFGEDVGKIGDVNQAFAGLQEKYGKYRVSDTGIREATIIGQGIGMAMRGLRPIAEMQYLDYLLYGLQPLSDDVATMQYRTVGGQKCPLTIRTRGHRLEGIWHSGSPMGMILNSVKGIHLCVPRNMVQAAGMYNTIMLSDEPAIVVECLNGYRLKEKMPNNINEFTVPFGKPEILNEGDDLTIVSYGSTLRIIQEAIVKYIEPLGINVELIDIQTLMPFDTEHMILESLKKTGRIIFIDEDVPSGATAYMFQQIIEIQGGYRYLDAAPRTLSAKAHRPAYATDGDYFSKPNAEDVARIIKEVMAD